MPDNINDFILFKAIDLFFGFMASIETIDVIIIIEWILLIITLFVIVFNGISSGKRIK